MSLFDKRNDGIKKVTLNNFNELMSYFSNNDLKYENIASDAFPICAFTYLECSYLIDNGYIFIINKNMELLHIPFNLDGEFIDANTLKNIMLQKKIKRIVCIPECSEFLKSDEYKSVFRFSKLRTFGYEYTYDNDLLSSVEGSQYRNFRSKLHKFEKYYGDNISIIEYDSSMYDDAIVAYDNWLSKNGEKIVNRGENIWDRMFYDFCLRHYKDLNIEFYLVYDLDECIGSVAYTVMNDTYSYGIFRKLSSDYQYIAQYMQNYQAKLLSSRGVKYLNDAYDGGEKGLENLKSDFKPIRKVYMYGGTIIK